jgi:hypothetical protein
MTTRTHHGVASVSKMVTTGSTLKMIDLGELAYDDRLDKRLTIPKALPHPNYAYLPSDKLMQATTSDVRIIELLTYTARFGNSSSASALWSAPRLATSCNTATYTDTTWKFNPDVNLRCNVGYQNAAFGMLGYIIAQKARVNLANIHANNYIYDQYTTNLSLNDAHVSDMVCGAATNDSKYYNYTGCTSGSDCFDGYKQTSATPEPASTVCASGHWKANAESALQMMAAFRYKKFLSDSTHQMLFSTELDGKNNGTAPVGWNSAPKLIDDEYFYSKAGGGTGVSAWVVHLPWGVDGIIMTNSEACNGCGSLGSVKDGFLNGAALD